jgi:hypothetical protein
MLVARMVGLERFNTRKFATMTLLSIILPVSLLISFRMSGITPEPQTPETTTVEAVTWNMSRPADYAGLGEEVNNLYEDGFISINFTVKICSYYENDPSFDRLDRLTLILSLDAWVSEGFIHSAIVKFSKVDTYSATDISQNNYHLTFVNLKLQRIVDWRLKMGNEAYLYATATNQPKNAYLQFAVHWLFADQNNVNHEVNITSECTLFNGIQYRKIIIPIYLMVAAAGQ